MSGTQYDTRLAEILQRQAQILRAPIPAPIEEAPQNTWVGGGLRAGVRELRSLGGSAVEALGKLTGLEGVEEWGASAAASNAEAARAAGRPDLEVPFWREGGAPIIPQVIYQVTKQLPNLALMFAGGAALPAAAARAGLTMPAALAAAGARVPSWLGGGAGLTGEAATAAGGQFARSVMGAAATQYPTAVGSLYQEATDRAQETGIPTTRGEAAAAFLGGVPYAVIEALEPAQLGALAKPLMNGAGLLSRAGATGVAKTALAAGVAQIPQEGLQTAMEQMFRSDLPLEERASRVVDAALMGGIVGGVFGGAAGSMRALRRVSPAEVTDEALGTAVDETVTPTQLDLPMDLPEQRAPGAPAQPTLPMDLPEQQAPEVVPPSQGDLFARSPALMPDTRTGQLELPGVAEQGQLPFGRLSPEAPAVLVEPNTPVEGQRELFQPDDLSVLGRQTPEQLAQFEVALQQRIAAGRATVQDELDLRRVRLALDAKTSPRINQDQPGLFGADALAQPSVNRTQTLKARDQAQSRAARDLAQQQAENADAGLKNTRAYLSDILGGKPAPRSVQATDIPSLVEAVVGAYESNASPAWSKKAMEHFGLIDAEGNPRNLQQEIATAQQALGLAEQRGVQADVEAATRSLKDLQQKADVLAQVEQRRQGTPVPSAPEPTLEQVADARIAQQQDAARRGAQGMPEAVQPTLPVEMAPVREVAPQEPSLVLPEGQPAGQGDLFARAPVVEQMQGVEPVVKQVATSQAQERQFPDGPFTGKASNVVGSVGVDVRYVQVLQGLMDQLGLKQRVLVAHPEDIRASPETYRLHGRYETARQASLADDNAYGSLRSFGPDNKDFVISLREGMSPAATLEVMTHEMGHLIQHTTLKEANTETRAAIEKDYQAWLKRADRMSAQELVRALRPNETGQMQAANIPADAQLDAKYWQSFGEWFADNVAKWATTDQKPLGVVQKFFASVAEKLKALVGKILGTDQAPAASVRKFLADMSSGDPTTWRDAMRPVESGPVSELSAVDTNATMERIADTAQQVRQTVQNARTNLSPALGRFERYISTLYHLAEKYGRLFGTPDNNPLLRNINAKEAGRSMQRHFGTMIAKPTDALKALQNSRDRVQKKAGQAIGEMMKLSELGLDPLKTWDQQHADVQNSPNAVNLRKALSDVQQHVSFVRQHKQMGVYNDLKTGNEALLHSKFATSLYMMVQLDPQLSEANIPGFEQNPADIYLQEDAGRADVTASRDLWTGVTDKMLAGLDTFLTSKMAEIMPLPKAQQAAAAERYSPITQMVVNTRKSIESTKKAPYFHLGRYGDHFVAFTMRGVPGADEGTTVVDPQAVRAIAEALGKAGFGDVQLSWANDRQNAFIMVETPAAARELESTIKGLVAKGLVETGSVQAGTKDMPIVAGRIAPRMLQQWKEQMQARAEFQLEKGMPAEQRSEIMEEYSRSIGRLMEFMMDVLPDSDINKVTVKREGVPGYSGDMLRNYARRAEIGVNAVANLSHASEVSHSLREIRAAVYNSQRIESSKRSPQDRANMQGVLDELTKRDAERPIRLSHDFSDTARTWTHGWFTAGSPAYALVQLTQVPVMAVPELAKKHGYVKAARTVAEVTGAAFRVMREAYSAGRKESLGHAAEGMITREVLDKAGLSVSDKDTLLQAVIRGYLGTSGAVQEMGRIAGDRGATSDQFLRYANAMGGYSETLSRVIAQLAAGRLHGEKPGKHDYVHHITREALMTFSEYNTSRLMGRSGFAGKLTPALGSLLSYQAQAVEKLYREMSTVLSKNAAPAQKKEARRFLVGHAVSVMTLAGALGLPAAALMARVVDKLVDELGDEGDPPFDSKAAFRNFLSDTFGKDIGEMLARGAPRALGADLSGRVGEADIIPFSKFLTDRRKAEDIAEDLIVRTAGAPTSAILNMVQGANLVFNRGDILGGAELMLPLALRNMVKSYRMTEQGYVDKQGNELPMTPNARSILMQALGFLPSEAAEYQEAKSTQTRRSTDAEAEAGQLRKRLAVAAERGDREGLQDALRRTMAFDARNPAYAVVPNLETTITNRARVRAESQKFQVPMGAPLKDLEGLRLYRFMNLQN